MVFAYTYTMTLAKGAIVGLVVIGSVFAHALVAEDLPQIEVYRSGENGYHSYRIPGLCVTAKGTLLAFAEGRRHSAGDSGDIDLLLRRSFDNGKTWQKTQVIANFGEDTVSDPAVIGERKSGTILLLFCSNPGRISEKEIVESGLEGGRTVWITRSADDGASWSKLAEITASVKAPGWTWYATGPGNGIQLRSGRLVVSCNHIRKDSRAMHSHVIYSDDRGQTWRIGGTAEEKTNESAVVELRDGSLLLNMRSYHGGNRRAIARSRDGGLTWSAVQLDPALIEPVCQASLIRAVSPGTKADGRLLFSNPADTTRVRMTVRLSLDDGKTWPIARLIHEGPSGYSSLAAWRDGAIGLLYERGRKDYRETITFARFPIAWLKQAAGPAR